jgi:hypothetical protein
MSLEFIRRAYKVPAHRGGRVRFCPCPGIDKLGFVVAAKGKFIRVRFSDMKRTVLLHPTYALVYLDGEAGI